MIKCLHKHLFCVRFRNGKVNRTSALNKFKFVAVLSANAANIVFVTRSKTGTVAQSTSGPSVTLSYLMAAIAAFFSALCYAEFGSRIPTTGMHVFCRRHFCQKSLAKDVLEQPFSLITILLIWEVAQILTKFFL